MHIIVKVSSAMVGIEKHPKLQCSEICTDKNCTVGDPVFYLRSEFFFARLGHVTKNSFSSTVALI